METIYRHIERIPESKHPSLQGYNAADELLLEIIPDLPDSISIYNDQFGFLSTNLAHMQPNVVCDLKSQASAITKNCELNRGFGLASPPLFLLDQTEFKTSVALLKIPKSLAMFEKYLEHIHQHLEDDGIVYAGFMTRYFSQGLLMSAGRYFEEIAQTKAQKKARILILKKKKTTIPVHNWETISYENHHLRQHQGVFSSKKIDKATLFLLDNLNQLIPEKHSNVIDLGCGNGVIASVANDLVKIDEIHLIDDSQLAIDSAKQNFDTNAKFHHAYTLDMYEEESIDWVITNPPFHFEHTIDTSIAKSLFDQAHRVLKPGSVLTIVANANLGYEPTLKQMFSEMIVHNSTSQFNIFQCIK